MKHILIAITLHFFALAGFAQNQADLLYNQGVDAYNTKDFNKAIELFTRCEDLNQSSQRQLPYYSSNASAYIAHILFLKGDTIKAKETSMEYSVEPVDQRRTIKSDSITIMAMKAEEDEDWNKAKDLFLQCAALEEEELGANHYYVANTYYCAANNAFDADEIQESRDLLERALSIYKLTYNYPLSYNAFQLYCITYYYYDGNDDNRLDYNILEDYKYGIHFCEDFINNFSNCETKDSIYVEFRAFLFSALRNYNDSSDYNNSIKIAKKIIDSFANSSYNEEEYYKALETLAFLYRDLNYFEETINIFNKILKLRENNGKEQTIEYARDLDLLAGCYYSIQNYEKAKDCWKLSLAILECVAPESTEYARVLVYYAKSCIDQDNKEEMLTYYKKAKEIMEKKDSLGYAYATLNNQLCNYYFEVKDWENAKICYQKARDIYIRLNNTLSEDYYSLLLTYMICCLYSENYDEIVPLEKEWYDLYTKKTIDAFRFLREEQRYNYYTPIKYYGFLPNILCTTIDHPDIRRIAYNMTLFTKGLLLSSTIGFSNFVYDTYNDSIISKYEQIRELRSSIFNNDDEDYIKRMKVNQLEESLIYDLKKYGDYTSTLEIKYDQISSNLLDNETAIEFATTGNNADGLLMAFVLKRNFDEPLCIILGSQDDFAHYISNNNKNIETTYNSLELSKLIWGSIINATHINEGDNIYFSPDGIIYQLGIEYLPTDDGRTMNEKYNIQRLSSTKELCFRKEKPTYTSATLYGGLAYDLDQSELIEESRKYESTTSRSADLVEKELIEEATRADRWGLAPLPATLIEVNKIEEILTEKNGIVNKLTDAKGNEESFKALSGKSPHILHVATHGIYFKKTEKEKLSQQNLSWLNELGPSKNVIDYSMSRTSLALSGATLALNNEEIPEGVEDGLLTAKEIAQLDLRNVDIAVLSACETGLGDITSDGVAGLQRGFKNAGVKSLLMSLWQVDDDATMLLMTEFYKNLMNGKSKSDSLKNAQLYLRNYEQNGKKIFPSPRYWASFILLDGGN